MSSLSSLRCFNHGTREAAARCPTCERFYCRECISEYDGAAICAGCLATKAAPKETKSSDFSIAFDLSRVVGGLLLCWLMLYITGLLLQAVPTTGQKALEPDVEVTE